MSRPETARCLQASRRWLHRQCQACGAAVLTPRPLPAALGRAYRTYYTHRTPQADPRTAAERASLSWRILDGYLRTEYGYGAAGDLGRAGWLVARIARGPRATADRFVRNLPRPGGRGRARVLDIGCGNGEFLLRMRERGWDVWGVEPDPVAAEAARAVGIDVLASELPAEPIAGAPFDAITLSHVIEHVSDPVDLLARCRANLRPGGVVWVLTPNLDSPGRAAYGPAWVSWDAPRHLVLFTRASLVRALEEAGFAQPRTCLPLVNARNWIYPVSEGIRAGGDGESPARLERSADVRARLNDLAVALGATSRAEELCLLAVAPG